MIMNNLPIEILLVEDNPDDAALTIRSLKKLNFANKLVHLEDGAEAIDFIFRLGKYQDRPLDNAPKVIFLDINMPKVSGLQVLEKLKSNDLTRAIPVVILTSSAEDPDIKRAYELGANSYIVKPVDFENFSKTVAELGMYWMMVNRFS
jgi:two-component system, response regulator